MRVTKNPRLKDLFNVCLLPFEMSSSIYFGFLSFAKWSQATKCETLRSIYQTFICDYAMNEQMLEIFMISFD